MSSAEKIICGTCKKYQQSSVDNTNQSGGFLQKEKIHPVFAGLYRPGKGWMPEKTPSVLPLRGNPPSPRGRLMAMPESFRFYERRPLEGQLPPAGGRCRAATKGGIWLCEAKTEGVTIRSHSAPASCPGGSAGRSTASGTPSPDTFPSRCSAARRRSTARPDSRSPPGTPTWTRCSRSW